MLRIRKFLVSVVAAGSLFASAFQVYALQGGDVALKAGGSHIKYDPGLNGSYYHHVTTDGEWTANIGAVAMVTDNVGIEVGMSWPAVFTTKGMVDFTSLGGG